MFLHYVTLRYYTDTRVGSMLQTAERRSRQSDDIQLQHRMAAGPAYPRFGVKSMCKSFDRFLSSKVYIR